MVYKDPEVRKAYMKAYREANKERLNERRRETQRLWRLAHPEKRKAERARYRENHLEEIRERYRAWREKNPEKAQAATKDWRERNKERLREYEQNRVRTDDRLVQRQRKQKYKAKQWNVLVETVDFLVIMERDRGICQICGVPVTEETLSFDHIIPLSKGGPHTEDNIQVAHIECNVRKGSSIPDPTS